MEGFETGSFGIQIFERTESQNKHPSVSVPIRYQFYTVLLTILQHQEPKLPGVIDVCITTERFIAVEYCDEDSPASHAKSVSRHPRSISSV